MARMFEDAGFRTHVIIFSAVNAGLAVINLWTEPSRLWFFWPLIGWGIGLLGHAVLVSRKPQRPAAAQLAATAMEPVGATPPSISAAKIEERALQLWQASGARAIAEAAERARSSEASGNAAEAETWRRIEAVLMHLRGPRAS